ncbi:MAG: protein kinase, partial [Deltaproteobacteria bacterium]|nr:protein kinase [Deltaproteobacteria bacterium]
MEHNINIPGYTIKSILFKTDLFSVYKTFTDQATRPATISIANNSLNPTPLLQQHFDTETIYLRDLQHPNLMPLQACDISPEGYPFFVAMFPGGQDLNDWLTTKRPSETQKALVLLQVSKALAYAHRNYFCLDDSLDANIIVTAGLKVMLRHIGFRQAGTVQTTVTADSGIQHDRHALLQLTRRLLNNNNPPGRTFSTNKFSSPTPLNLKAACRPSAPAAETTAFKLLSFLKGDHLRLRQRQQAPHSNQLNPPLVLLDCIKETVYGAVYLYACEKNSQPLIMKKLPHTDNAYARILPQRSLHHPHLVSITDVSHCDDDLLISMEYMRGGSLQERLVRTFDMPSALTVLKQICLGLAYIHRTGHIHGNLRPSNILYDEHGIVKIADAGQPAHYGTSPAMANWYMLDDDKGSIENDIYACGVMLYQMLTGALPEWVGIQLVADEHLDLLHEDLTALLRGLLESGTDADFKSIDAVIDSIKQLEIPSRPVHAYQPRTV